MKYRNKPRIVDAIQWFPGHETIGVEYEYSPKQLTITDETYGTATLNPIRDESSENVIQWKTPRAYVTTIHGQRVYLSPGDYVITEPDGIHHYPCKPEIFEQNYEKITQDEIQTNI